MKNLEDFIEQMYSAYRLKFEWRYSGKELLGGKESVAAHTWAMTLLADFFLDYLEEISPGKYTLNKLKIYDYILYHDLVEAEVGDIDNSTEKMHLRANKEQNEKEGALVLAKKLPRYLGKKFYKTFIDYENMVDNEAVFAKCMDVLEGQIHAHHCKEIWKGYNGQFYKERFYRSCFDSFPELKEIVVALHNNLIAKGFFPE